MKPTKRLNLAASLRFEVMPMPSFPELECWGCGSWLEMHQPDENRPDQFLAICLDCGRWYVLETRGEEDQLVTLELPDLSQFESSGPASRDGPTN